MKKIKLNTHKVITELERIGKTQVWLAKELGITHRQQMNEILKRKSPARIDAIAKALKFDPRDLIIFE